MPARGVSSGRLSIGSPNKFLQIGAGEAVTLGRTKGSVSCRCPVGGGAAPSLMPQSD